MIGHLTNYSGIRAHDTELFDQIELFDLIQAHYTELSDQIQFHESEFFDHIADYKEHWFSSMSVHEFSKRWFKYQQISSVPIQVHETMYDELSEERHFIANLGVVFSIGVGRALLATFNFHNNTPTYNMDCIKELKIIGYFSTDNIRSVPEGDPQVQIRFVKKRNDIYELGYVHYNLIMSSFYHAILYFCHVSLPPNYVVLPYYDAMFTFSLVVKNIACHTKRNQLKKNKCLQFFLHEIPMPSALFRS